MTTQSLGQAIDSIWIRLPKDHALHKIRPQSLPSPHEHYLMAGKTILALCEEEGVVAYAPLPKTADHEAWLRLVAAWSLWNRDHKVHESRANVAQKLDIDPSNLTNFLNGKRALTQKALLALSNFLGVQPYDIRPELGAISAGSAQRKSIKYLRTVKNGLQDIEQDILALQASGVPVESLVRKVGCVISSLG
ncbi:XRE family transcriptional regulator (plasmid) [Pseudomonas sp. Leaf58]|uniref:helix-turn-helix domain-containing protein n=1 Tax=Pseudomonas sp. Leaf58 TaxID=1736226 RepID=UPI0009EB0F0B|nr:helix-turn-helix transcriptional regulator [Pseudomonas sp. Leaf58]AYG48376.1 XRE family transcriptional regulator [Pseudomonas sp. Leaf58]